MGFLFWELSMRAMRAMRAISTLSRAVVSGLHGVRPVNSFFTPSIFPQSLSKTTSLRLFSTPAASKQWWFSIGGEEADRFIPIDLESRSAYWNFMLQVENAKSFSLAKTNSEGRLEVIFSMEHGIGVDHNLKATSELKGVIINKLEEHLEKGWSSSLQEETRASFVKKISELFFAEPSAPIPGH